ncbi:hypothetical protein HMPREF3213_01793 [Heyndrickxia coagulans]|uniref:Uncharacterized protein n=1 Tax=Heyndrickxia coagulans TaxID=1398 RepID=A0A133KSA6_HEYCO|nr:hypothetical protein HMPREF3213_01793 [Heyndrickxia coagulans]
MGRTCCEFFTEFSNVAPPLFQHTFTIRYEFYESCKKSHLILSKWKQNDFIFKSAIPFTNRRPFCSERCISGKRKSAGVYFQNRKKLF